MSDSIVKSFEQTCENIFFLKYVTLLINKADLDNAPDGPKVVLASVASLETCFSHVIFVEWASDMKNLELFTERGQITCLAKEWTPKPLDVTVEPSFLSLRPKQKYMAR
ncbi:hypothetical protein PIB30_027395 [Stylosanthes scabra]|uniref:Cleavage and polyadenylation specificity factor subunit 2 n=1 Tax=Stylosanthes scabra TaxID=79078 RepID=A0ABU6UA37_9FABA|nr:hypothetical protein [Stylosanthes scabra]